MKEDNDYSMVTVEQVAMELAERARALRLMRRWKQSTLADRAGVSLASLRRFEQTGRISLRSLLCISFVLGRLSEYEALMSPSRADSIAALEAMISSPGRKRGSR